MTHSRTLLAALVIAMLLGAACASPVRRKDWSSYDGPGASYLQREEIVFPHFDDPIEPANRVLAFADLQLTRFVFAPLASFYRLLVPQAVRVHLAKAGDNILFPTRFVNNLLQGKLNATSEEMARFALNTTVGLLGLFDPATQLGLHPHPEDFGQTLATWGWRRSLYLYLPILGPSSLRDGLGQIPDVYTDPTTYYPPAALGRRFIAISDQVDDALRLVEINYDAYELARTVNTLNREVDASNFSWQSDDSSATQSLEAIFLTPKDFAFPSDGSTESIPIEWTGEALPYTLWLQPKPAPLVYLLPGLGGHRLGDATLALAELLFVDGNSVVTISNPTNWEFIKFASSVDLPGYAPIDSLDVHRVLSAIDARLASLRPDAFTSKRLAGISLGAFLTLFIAANERERVADGLLRFDIYVALDPAVTFEHALEQLDRFYNAPLVFPVEERDAKIDEIFAKVLYLSHGELEPGVALPFTRLEAEFLIGLSFRMDLQFLLLQTQESHDLGVLQTPRSRLRRAPAFCEASEYSYMEYMYAFALPYLATKDLGISFDEAGGRTIFSRCDLRAIEAGLASNDRVRVFANENDFLLRPEDLEWLKSVLGERARFFPAGGHLGNLHRKSIQAAIQSVVDDADDGQP
ncbi:MAG: VacJ family lipoprotein [Planctomycetes bacterium]|nr:VacJ family lipoprotein [Planctomycetota bacterium]